MTRISPIARKKTEGVITNSPNMAENLRRTSPVALKPLPRSFYLRPTLQVARSLIGKIFIRNIGDKSLTGMIVEVEAYCGKADPASHAFRRMTDRNRVMFGIGGTLYVYFTYGMHFCANVVTEGEGKAGAVLIRAVEPLEGLPLMRKNRVETMDDRQLTNGPAKFCQAFGIGRDQNGTDLCGEEIYVAEETPFVARNIAASPRIGITTATEKKWRFYIKNNLWVSKLVARKTR
jgi:DNA-3-methyladenine glycosylase